MKALSELEIKEDSTEQSTVFIENATSKRFQPDGQADSVKEEDNDVRRGLLLLDDEQLKKAKLDLVREEDAVEKVKKEEAKVTKRLKKECQLMESTGKSYLQVELVDILALLCY